MTLICPPRLAEMLPTVRHTKSPLVVCVMEDKLDGRGNGRRHIKVRLPRASISPTTHSSRSLLVAINIPSPLAVAAVITAAMPPSRRSTVKKTQGETASTLRNRELRDDWFENQLLPICVEKGFDVETLMLTRKTKKMVSTAMPI